MKLANGYEVLAATITNNSEGRRAAIVVCEETHIDSEFRYVTWVAWMQKNDEWETHWGHYMLSWDEAMESMHNRFVAQGFTRRPTVSL